MSLSLFRGIVDGKNPRMRAAVVLPRILLASFATTACVSLAANPVPDASPAATSVAGQEKSSHPGESMGNQGFADKVGSNLRRWGCRRGPEHGHVHADPSNRVGSQMDAAKSPYRTLVPAHRSSAPTRSAGAKSTT